MANLFTDQSTTFITVIKNSKSCNSGQLSVYIHIVSLEIIPWDFRAAFRSCLRLLPAVWIDLVIWLTKAYLDLVCFLVNPFIHSFLLIEISEQYIHNMYNRNNGQCRQAPLGTTSFLSLSLSLFLSRSISLTPSPTFSQITYMLYSHIYVPHFSNLGRFIC